MFYKHIIVIFLVIKIVNGIIIEKSNVINKKTNLLGVEYDYLVGQVEFDEELYLFDEWVSCPFFNYKSEVGCSSDTIVDGISNELIDCSCDYTNKSECPKVLDSRCNNVCSNNEDDYQCNGEWIVLDELDKQYIYSINKPTQFRYKANGLECNGISVKINSIDGYGTTTVGSNLNSNNQRKTSSTQYQRNVLFNLCPSFNIVSNNTGLVRESWTSNTYFIEVSPILDFYNFSITLHSIKINNDSVNDCTSNLSTHNCLTVNKANQFTQNEFYGFFNLEIKESGYYYFSFPSIDNSIFYYISDKEYNNKPFLGKSTWELSDDYENSILLYLEPINDQPLNIYITSIMNLENIVNVKPSSNIIISVTNIGKKYLEPISKSLSIQAGSFSLRGTSKLILNRPSGEQIYYSTPTFATAKSKAVYSILYPQIEFNTIIPASQFIFDSDVSKSIRNQVQDFTIFKPKSYQFSFLLDKSTTLSIIQNDYKDIKFNSILSLSSNIFDKNGLPISLNTTFNNENLLKDCSDENYKLLSNSMKNMSTILHNTINYNIGSSLIFNLNLLTMSDIWEACQLKMNDYYKENLKTEIQYSKHCPYSTDDPLYLTHPCCSLIGSYYECCNPTPTATNVSRYSDFNLNRIEDECASLDCTLSVLTELNRTILSIHSCSVSQLETSKISYDAIKVLRDCKQVLVSPFCTTDKECSSYGSANKCDLYKRECISDYESVDKQYIECVLTNLSIGAVYYLLNGSTQVNETVINSIYYQHLNRDCIGQSVMDRSTYTFLPSEFSTFCNINDGCLDKSCPLAHDICFDGDLLEFAFRLDSRIDKCNTYGFCPSNSECINSEDCISSCIQSSFCGYCSSNSTQCYNIKDLTNETSCQDQNKICLLADGTFLLGLTDEECSNKGLCSHGCGYSCTTSIDENVDAGCFAIVNDKDNCNLQSGEWSEDSNSCYLPSVTKDNCNSQDQTWVDCGSKSTKDGECYGPNFNLFICKAKPTKCLNQSQCELESGKCSDQYYFSNKASNLYPSGLGKCVHNHTFELPPYPVQCVSNEKDSPEGCYSTTPNKLTREECEATEGFRFWTPANSREECLNSYGCSTIETLDIGLLPFNFKFNEMNQDQCLNGCSETLNQWINKYEWISGKWLPGISIKAQWLSNKNYISNKIVENVFDYQSFYSQIISASDSQILELFKTESFCKTERLRNSLDSLVCSCLHSNQESSCFGESSPVLGQTKVCSNQQSYFKFDYGIIEFSNDSIDQTCQIFTVSQISKELYTSTVQESLASNFVSYNKPDNFAVVNSKDAIIGMLLGDGIMISNSMGISEARLCFKNSTSLYLSRKDKYPVLDIAIQINQQSKPTPLDIEISLQLLNDDISNSSIEYLCANILEIPSGDPIYFIINRFDDWKNINKQLFDRETRGLMYTLAALFLIVSAVGVYEVFTIIYLHWRKIITNFQPIQLLVILTTIFITIRSIYFFLLVNGKLDNNPVLDYILVVLPTFIYFTSFTLIIAIWYCIVFLVLRNNRGNGLSVRFYKLIFVVNLILYLFFIVIVIIFQYAKYKGNNDCGLRIVIPNRISNQQKGISLAYAIAQAALSLAIGSAFLYLGYSLYKTIVSNSKGFSNTKHQNKIIQLSIICSIGFILHCAFIIVLVTNINSIIFSFIGLVITEILPVVSILYCFNPNSIKKEREIKSNGNELKTKKKITSEKLSKITNINNENNMNNI